MNTTDYFSNVVVPKRPYLTEALVMDVVRSPEIRRIQSDGRLRLWGRPAALGGRWLRVVLLPDAKTVHNAFIDRDPPIEPSREGAAP